MVLYENTNIIEVYVQEKTPALPGMAVMQSLVYKMPMLPSGRRRLPETLPPQTGRPLMKRGGSLHRALRLLLSNGIRVQVPQALLWELHRPSMFAQRQPQPIRPK
jgi:hypothetical protein